VRSPVDVVEDESGITLSADLPGLTKDRLQVRVDGETLMVEGEASLDVPTGTEPVYAEVPPLIVYRRSFTLSRARWDKGECIAQGWGARAPHPQDRGRQAAAHRRKRGVSET
jgi:hypothetical protein